MAAVRFSSSPLRQLGVSTALHVWHRPATAGDDGGSVSRQHISAGNVRSLEIGIIFMSITNM